MTSASDPVRTHGPLIAIDLLRLASAVFVLAFHYGTGFWVDPDAYAVQLLGPAGTSAAAPFTWWGWVGVELFFVISGFVIAFSASTSTAAGFVKRRLLRLAPGAWICATLTFAGFAAAGVLSPETGGEWLRSILFWPTGSYIDRSYWTLAVELSFYAGVFLLLLLGRRDRLEAAARVLGVASLLFWCLATLLPADTAILHNRELQLLLLTHGCFFALGVQIWAALTDGATPRRIAWAAIFFTAGLIEIVWHAIERAQSLGVAGGPAVPLALFTLGVAVVALAPRLQPRLERLLRPAQARLLGLATYPLYLIHQSFAAVLLGLLLPHLPLAAAMIVVLIAIAVTTLVIVHAETKLRRRLDMLLTRAALMLRPPRPAPIDNG